jgi:hypothetical protein
MPSTGSTRRICCEYDIRPVDEGRSLQIITVAADTYSADQYEQ